MISAVSFCQNVVVTNVEAPIENKKPFIYLDKKVDKRILFEGIRSISVDKTLSTQNVESTDDVGPTLARICRPFVLTSTKMPTLQFSADVEVYSAEIWSVWLSPETKKKSFYLLNYKNIEIKWEATVRQLFIWC